MLDMDRSRITKPRTSQNTQPFSWIMSTDGLVKCSFTKSQTGDSPSAIRGTITLMSSSINFSSNSVYPDQNNNTVQDASVQIKMGFAE